MPSFPDPPVPPFTEWKYAGLLPEDAITSLLLIDEVPSALIACAVDTHSLSVICPKL